MSLICLSMISPATAVHLISAVSSKQLNITSNFDGAKLTLFGSVEDIRDLEKGFELAIIVEGPKENLVVRQKEQKFGVWLNGQQESYQDVPSFISIHTSAPLSIIAHEKELRTYQIGFENLRMDKRAVVDDISYVNTPDFREAIIRLRGADQLYQENIGSIQFLSRTLFTTSVGLPERIKSGEFHVKTYLFHNKEMVASQNETFVITKTGFNRVLFDISKKWPLFYGVCSVLIAFFVGWLGGIIFRRV